MDKKAIMKAIAITNGNSILKNCYGFLSPQAKIVMIESRLHSLFLSFIIILKM